MGISGPLSRTEPALLTKANPTASRIKMRPIPGHPPANVEYKRRKGRASPQDLIFIRFPIEWSPTRRPDRASFEAEEL
jgi:hypothetical protein